MPQRINGIGTAYLGKSNVQTRPGECESCRRGVALSSYDTRLWFTFFFIPLIPLGRKRIQEYCPSCTTHRAMPLAAWEALKKKTMEEAARKALAEPANAEAQVELHRACLLVGEWEKADAFQKKLEEEFAKDAKTQLYLASAHAYRGRGAEAEAALARARALDPNIAPPPEPPKPPVKSAVSNRPALIIAAVIAGLAIAGFSAASVVKAGARTLYVVSGLDQPLTVEIEGRPAVSVWAGGRVPVEIPEGRHRARVSGAVQQEIDFTLESNFFTRLFDERVFVLNPGGSGLLVVWQNIYSSRKVTHAELAPPRLHFGRTFFAIDDIDYVFAPFPSQIKTKESGDIKKHRLELVAETPSQVIYWLLDEKRPEDARAVAEWAVRSRPQERGLVLNLYAGLEKNPERYRALLKERVALRPVDVEAHRAYQGLTPRDVDALRKEYDGLLATSPKDPDLLYLRGRLEPRVKGARSWYDKALAENPKHPWSNFALAYGFETLGDWAAAKDALAKAVEARPTPEFKEALRRARLGAGDFEPLFAELKAALAKTPSRLTTNVELARAYAASGRIPEAKALLQPFRDALRNAKDPNPAEHARTLEGVILYAAGEFDALLKLSEAGDRPYALLELGKIDEAIKAGDPEDPAFALALAVVRPEDAKLREAAAEALEGADDDAAPLAKALRSGAEADLADALEASIDVELKAVALAALAKRIPARAAELRERAAKLNRLWAFPYHLLKRALDGVK